MKRIRETVRTYAPWAAPAAVAIFMLIFRLDDVAGLHRDEAAFGLFAERIMEGLRPVTGFFNTYTAPIHSYIIAATFRIFGKSIITLRASGIVFNLIAAAAYIDVIRRIMPGRAVFTAWLLVSLPLFTIFGRIAGENYALNPLFLFGGIWCYVVLGNKESRTMQRTGYFISGLFFYCGVWNHVVFLPAIFSIMAVYGYRHRSNITPILKSLPWMALGVIIGLIPKLYGVFILGHNFIPPSSSHPLAKFTTSIPNFIYTLGGDALYNRACGETMLSFNWLLPICLFITIVIAALPKKFKMDSSMLIDLLVIVFLTIVFTTLITPDYLVGSRLWLLPVWLVPLIIAIAVSSQKINIQKIIITGMVVIGLFSIGINYFHSFLQQGGASRKNVYVGGRFDNSWDFIDIRPLIKNFESLDGKFPIVMQDFNLYRVQFLMRKDLAAMVYRLADRDINRYPDKTIIALMRTEQPNPESLPISPVRKADRIPGLSTRHYDVYQISDLK